MEDYINDDNIIKDDIYNMFKATITCFLCEKILINPMMCMNCQKDFCKKCIDNWVQNNDKCPKGCDNPNYQKSLLKNDLLSKLKFKCKKCGGQVLYEEVKKHYEECKGSESIQTPETSETSEVSESSETKKLKKLTPEDVDKLKQKGNEVEYFKSKKNNYL